MTKKLLATSLFAACLTTTALGSTYALAEDEDVYFYPKNKWTIEQVEVKANSYLKTCAISNQLNNGYIIQLAGNSDGFTNLNIDFRQDSFETNLKYEVKYSVPGIAEEIIPTKAFKKNLLVSDLRDNKEFANALRASNVLDVQIRGSKFRMYLTGLGAAMDSYSECVAPQVIATAKEDVTERKLAIKATPTQYKEIKSTAPPPPINMHELANSAPVTSQQEADMPAYKLRPEPSSRIRYTEKLAAQLKEESDKYKPEKGKLVETIEPEASIEQNIKFSSQRAKSKAIYNVTKLDPISVDLTAQALSNIEPASSNTSDDFINMRGKISELEQQVGALLNKNKMLDEELKIVLKDSKNEKISVSSDNWNLERSTMKFNEAERQITRLGRKLQTQKNQCQQEKTELEAMLFDPKLTSQQQLANLTSLETELDIVRVDFSRKKRQYEERIKLLEARLDLQ